VTFVTRTEIDAVPVFWRDEGEDLAVASIMFRAGTADETLPTHGVTHLLEHVALDFGRRRYPFNGMVDATRTLMTAHGTPEQLTEFLGTVCARLADLDSDRSIGTHESCGPRRTAA
jgi:zinc protease